MNKRFYMGLTVALLLLGCNSFNRTEYHATGDTVNTKGEKEARQIMGPPTSVQVAHALSPDVREVIRQEVREELKEEARKAAKNAALQPKARPKAPPKRAVSPVAPLCPKYEPPPLGKMPELPFEELEAAKGDQIKIDALEHKHIAELRRYILDRREVRETTLKKYNEDCKKIMEGKAP